MSGYNLKCSPGKVEIVPLKFEKRKECPQGPRPHPLTSDPDMFDPRPPQRCSRNPCCGCRPLDPPKRPKCYDLKLKLLQDCYNCKNSDKCETRRINFYDRWQVYMDNLPRYPNYDYKVYCCDDYVDLSKNTDFDKYSYYKPNLKGKRDRDRKHFIWPEVLFQTQEEQETGRDMIKRRDTCPCRTICDFRDQRYYAEAELLAHKVEPYTFWHQQILGPVRFVEGATPFRSRTSPFHKDASFSTPLQEISTGNESPFKEIRDVKVAM